MSNGLSTIAESGGSVGAGNIGSSRGCILGGGEGLSWARDILVAKAEAGSRSMSSQIFQEK